jgi:peptidyl-prolyl cis-trans isomerase SurA
MCRSPALLDMSGSPVVRLCLAGLLAALSALASLPAAAQGLRVPPNLGSPPAGSATPAARGGAESSNATVERQRSADYVVAMVNAEPVTNNEVRERALRLGQQIQLQGADRPAQTELLQMALEMLISEKLQMQMAELANVKIDTALIALAEQNVAAQNRLTLDEVLKRLQQDGISREQFRQTLRNQLTMTKLREREVDARVKVTDNEVDQFLAEQRNAPAAEVSLNIAQVLVAVPESASETQRASLQARAQKVLERARAGEDFSALAKEFSDGPEAQAGGMLGLRPIDRYPELFVDAVAPLGVGGIAGPLRSGAGLHVVKLVERNQMGGIPSRVTQSRARHILLRTGPQLSEVQAIERLEAMKRSLAAGQADFAALARQHSQDSSARDGGELGWVNPGQFVPEFEAAINALDTGQLSAPVVTRFGVHLVQLLERRETPLGERDRRAIARNLVRQKKTEEAYNLWLLEMRGSAFVQMRQPPQ